MGYAGAPLRYSLVLISCDLTPVQLTDTHQPVLTDALGEAVQAAELLSHCKPESKAAWFLILEQKGCLTTLK